MKVHSVPRNEGAAGAARSEGRARGSRGSHDRAENSHERARSSGDRAQSSGDQSSHETARALVRDHWRSHAALGELLAEVRSPTVLAALGFARFRDYVVERVGQTARWAAELIALRDMLVRFPTVRAAYEQSHLSATKVLGLADVLTDENAWSWCAWASSHTVHDLERATARATRGEHPPGPSSPTEPRDSEPEPRAGGAWMEIPAPAAVAHLFDYTVDVVRRLNGTDLSVTACVEHLLADYASAHAMPCSHTAETLARAKRDDAAASAGRSRVPPTSPRPGNGPRRSPRALDRAIRAFVRARQRRHGELAAALHAVKRDRSWCALGYGSFDAYCREALGLSPRHARELVWADRRFRALPLVAQSYFEGHIGWSKARLVLSICVTGTQRAWIDRAREVTVRYLAHEVLASRRRSELDPEKRPPTPLPLSPLPPSADRSPIRPGAGLWSDDAPADDRGTTAEGAHREEGPNAGGAHRPSADAGDARGPSPGPWHTSSRRAPELPCRIRFWLPWDLFDFYQALTRDARTRLAHLRAPWEVLFQILGEFLTTWDRKEVRSAATQHHILERDGYHCAVPGCSARRGLEVHHIVFRSQGGKHGAENLITLCAVHHRLVLHETHGIACRGAAPHALHWRVGRAWYRGDIETAAPIR